MKFKKSAQRVLPALIVGAGALFVFMDTAPYRAALQEFKEVSSPAFLTQELAAISSDVHRAAACDRSNSPTPRDDTWRTCFLPVLSKIGSENGAIIAAAQAVQWLTHHPEDVEMRAAAHGAIAQGWKAYERNLPILTAQQRVIDARSHSIIFKIVDDQSYASSLVESRAEVLKKLEVSIGATSA